MFLVQTFRKKTFNFLIQSFIYLYLDTCFLYYKGILAFIFEHIMVQEILCNKSLQNTNRYKVSQVLSMYDVFPCFSLKNLGKKAHILHDKIQYFKIYMENIEHANAFRKTFGL